MLLFDPKTQSDIISQNKKWFEKTGMSDVESIEKYIGPGEVNQLVKPKKDSYKTKNGELFIMGGSSHFHGAPMMSIMGASKFIGSVYFYTSSENRELVKDIKSKVREFINVEDSNFQKYAEYADSFLIGPGLEDNFVNRAILREIFEKFPEKKKVIDAYAIAMVPEDISLKNCILTPHRGELRHIFGEKLSEKMDNLDQNLKEYVQKRECIVVLKGYTDMIYTPNDGVRFVRAGNPGMAKGGTGDILSGIIAALTCKNDLNLAAYSGTFLSGLGGDLAYEEFRYNYSATDLIQFIQKAAAKCEEFVETSN